MKPYIEDLVVNEEVVSFFLLSEAPQVRKSKKEKDYLCLKLQDKTGNIEGRVWDIPAYLDVKTLVTGVVIKVRAGVSEWNDAKQLNVNQIRLINDADEVELGDYFERSIVPPEQMWDELYMIIESLDQGRVKDLIFAIMFDNKDALMTAPAAKTVHHNYVGGLLEHVLSLSRTAIAMSARYNLRLELMLAACVLHDIGKVREFKFPVISYSLEGTMIGHIPLGMQMVAKKMDEMEDFDHRTRMEILHLIISHHGLLEWGSPKVPLMREAIAFHLIDALDAKLATCERAIKKGINEEGLTEWVKELGGPLYVGQSNDKI